MLTAPSGSSTSCIISARCSLHTLPEPSAVDRSLWRLELIHFCLVAAQDQGRNSVIESRHVNQVDHERQELGGDQPDIAGTLEEIVRAVTNGESADEIEEEKARH